MRSARHRDPGVESPQVGVWIFAIALALGMPAAAYGVVGWMAHSPMLLIERIEINGVDRLSESEILAAGGLDIPRSVVTLNEHETVSRISELPWVETVGATVDYRSRSVQVDVVERAAAAIVIAETGAWVVDRAGQVIVPFADARGVDAPVVVGLPDVALEEASSQSWRAAHAMDVIARIHASELGEASRVRELQDRGPMGYRVVMDSGTELRLTYDRLDERLDAVRIALARLEEDSERATLVRADGQLANRVVVQATRLHDGDPTATE